MPDTSTVSSSDRPRPRSTRKRRVRGVQIQLQHKHHRSRSARCRKVFLQRGSRSGGGKDEREDGEEFHILAEVPADLLSSSLDLDTVGGDDDAKHDEDDGTENEPCAVCLEGMGIDGTVWQLGQCGHKFHVHCILRAFRKARSARCPLCRGEGRPDTSKEDEEGDVNEVEIVDFRAGDDEEDEDDDDEDDDEDDQKVCDENDEELEDESNPDDKSARSDSSRVLEVIDWANPPAALFQIFSQLPCAKDQTLPSIDSRSFRTLDSVMESLGRSDKSPSVPSAEHRWVCGRSEFHNKVPKWLEVEHACPDIKAHWVVKFVNREAFLLDVFGRQTVSEEGVLVEEPQFFICALAAKGLHVAEDFRPDGVWQWHGEGQRFELKPNAAIAFILDNEDEEMVQSEDIPVRDARCLLGIQFIVHDRPTVPGRGRRRRHSSRCRSSCSDDGCDFVTIVVSDSDL
mmetsp:Transcript_24428/g.53082  ORF Transcript_24428/g.53082 Transcript_24428/m.53082 type:complete len:456 (-) Transcript_24428:88-1455(-)